MAGLEKFKIGEAFRPSPNFKKLYYGYLLMVVVATVIFYAFMPLLFILTAPLPVAVLAAILYWIPKYYDSTLYRLSESEIRWSRGVWFKTTGIVPYNRITNIDVVQGPISRALGISSIRIQTAGYSATSGGRNLAEIRMEGIEQPDELRELIMRFVRGRKPMAVETYQEDSGQKMLGELARIRVLLEKSLQKTKS